MSTNVLRNNSFVLKAALFTSVAVFGLSLAACTDEEINAGIASIKGDLPPPTQASPAAQNASLAPSSSVEPAPRFILLPGNGPMGEELAKGPDCHNEFRTRICMDQPSPYPWWPTDADNHA